MSLYTDIGDSLKIYSTGADFMNGLTSYICCINLSENVTSVLDEISRHCNSIANAELLTAIARVKTASKSVFDSIMLSLNSVVQKVFWQEVVGDAIDELWESALGSIVGELAGSILLGQAIGKTVANMLFSTDKVIEQWYKMNAFVTIERALVDSINSLANKYINSHDDGDAQVFITSLDLLAETYTQDYIMSEDLCEYLYEQGAWNNIKKSSAKLFGKYDSSQLDSFHNTIEYLKSSVSDLKEMLTQDYYQNFYEIDNNLSQTEINNIDFYTGKIISVACPTDVDVYDSNGNLCLSVKNNEVVISSFDNFIIVDGEIKRFLLNSDDNYSVVITGTDTGTMDYNIYEISNNKVSRTVSYYDVELEKDKKFSSEITAQLIEPISQYNLITESGEIIEADYDSLPLLEDNIVDVVVAEELFDGFSTDLIDLVSNTMFNFKTSVDVSSYQISTDDIVALFSAIAKYYPTEYSMLSKTDFSYRASVSPSLGIVTKLRFFYDDDVNLSDFQRQTQECNAEINKLVAEMEGMNDFEKALYVHDYILLNSEYGLELLDIMEKSSFRLDGELRSERYTEYSILVNGTGVCGSYALAYRAVLNAAGMECLYLSSSQMNHAWNLVKIDGKWYHVDVCWDDPVPDTYGQARRTYFLRTDEEIMNLRHYSWTPGQYKATSILYSEMPRNYDITQKYDYSTDSWYLLSGSKVYKYDKYGVNEQQIASISATSISVDNGCVYYSVGRNIYNFNAEKNDSALVYKIPKSKSGADANKAYIRNMYVNGDSVEYYEYIYDENGKGKTLYEVGLFSSQNYAIVTGLELNTSEISLDVFDTDNLKATILTSNGKTADVEVDWVSSNNNIVSVENGNMVAKIIGTATVTASLGLFSASCKVTVNGNGLEGVCGDNTKWIFAPESGTLTISGSGKMTNYYSSNSPWYKLREKINNVCIGNSISTIGNCAFDSCSSIKSITIPDSVTSIGYYAFEGCSNLESITIPNSVTSIDDYAFRYCSTTAEHAIDPEMRKAGVEIAKPIVVGNNVWIGAGSTILAGSVIGDNTVIGAGSVVKGEIPSNVVAVGVPCKPIREITEQDKYSYPRHTSINR